MFREFIPRVLTMILLSVYILSHLVFKTIVALKVTGENVFKH